MKSFLEHLNDNRSLTEAVSIDNDLLGHLTHVKDIPHESPKHTMTSVGLIRDFHHLRQGKPSGVTASLKHDGRAAGHLLHEHGGRVGVSDKHKLARGVVAYSDDEVDKHFGKYPEYATALKHLRKHGHEIVSPGHHVQGDILWSPGDKSKSESGKTEYTPNRITYHAKSSAPLGIALHSEIKNGVAYGLSKRATRSSKNIFVPREDFNPSEHEYKDEDKKAVEHHLDQAEKLISQHTTEHLTPAHIEHLTIYHNRVARGGRKPTVEGYASYLRSRGEEAAGKLKTEAGKTKARNKFESMAQHAETNKEHFNSSFNRSIQIRHHLQAATDRVLNGIHHPDLETTIDGKKSRGEGVVLRVNNRPAAKLVHSDIQHALGNNPRFPNEGAIYESAENTDKKVGVGVIGKVRFATIGHKKVVDKAKEIARDENANLHIHLTGASDPLTPEQKKQHAEAMFDHPVESTTDVFDSLSRLSEKYHTLHLVAGSDRANVYRKIAEKNGQPDKSGKVPFYFPGGIHVHEVEGKRTSIADIGKHPTKMNRDELERSASATEVTGLAKSGDYEGFKAYHPGINDEIVKRNYDTIRSQSSQEKPKRKRKKTIKEIKEDAKKEFYSGKHTKGPSQLDNVSDTELDKLRKMFTPDEPKKKLNEKMDKLISFRKRIDAMRLVPTRSSSKGDEE